MHKIAKSYIMGIALKLNNGMLLIKSVWQ